MIKGSVPYVLCRIEEDSSLTPVSEHEDFVDAVVAGKHQVEVEDFDFSYGVYANGRRVICFAEGRIGYREWARRSGRLGEIHSLELARIGSQRFAFNSATCDQIVAPPLFVTFTTRLSAQPLRRPLRPRR